MNVTFGGPARHQAGPPDRLASPRDEALSRDEPVDEDAIALARDDFDLLAGEALSGELQVDHRNAAVVDDGGVSVVYLQLSGERFARQEVEVVARQGDRILVDGLVPGQRLVTRGGEAIRRAGLMSSGAAEGHVH